MLNFKKNQILILNLFFSNPDKEYYFREIAKIIGVKPGAIQLGINRLEDQGFLKSRFIGNNRFFSINKSHPLYKEYKLIFSKTVGIEGSLKGLIQSIDSIDASFVYGSIAAGKETGESDIDLFIIGSPDEDMLIKKIDVLEKNLGRDINYTLYSKKEFKSRLNKKDSFLINLVKRPKIMLEGDLDEFK